MRNRPAFVCVRVLLVSIVLLTAPALGNAQTTDVAQKVGGLLEQKGPVPVTVMVNQLRTRERCIGGHGEGGGCRSEGFYVQVPQTTNQILTATNIQIVSSTPVVFGDMQRTELPDRVYLTDFFAQSCTGAPALNENQTLQKAFQRSASIQIQHSVTNVSGSSANIGIAIKASEVLGFNIGGQIQTSTSQTTGTVSVDSTQETITKSVTVSSTVLPGNAAVLELKFWPVHFVIPFSTTVTVDADVSPNDANLKRLSQIFPDPAVRTFDISGTIEAVDASAAVGVIYAIQYDPTKCPAGAKTATKANYEVPPGQVLNDIEISKDTNSSKRKRNKS